MNRIELKTPEDLFSFDIVNGNLKRSFTWWAFYPEWDNACRLRSMGASSYKMNEVLKVCGSHARLWLDDHEGTIAPMDVPPQGWCYPNGDLLEPEWWWQWHPKEDSHIVEFLNCDPIAAWEKKSTFKSGLPFQMQRQTGQIKRIEAIPMMRLPGLVKKNTVWHFEF